MHAVPALGAVALIALFDPNADEELRMNGALLIAGMAQDLRMLRSVYVKTPRR